MPSTVPGTPWLPSPILFLESSFSSLKSHPSFSLRTSSPTAQAWFSLPHSCLSSPLDLPLSWHVPLCAVMVGTTGMTPFNRINLPWITVLSSGKTPGPAQQAQEFWEGGEGYRIYLSQLTLHFYSFGFSSPSSQTLDILSSPTYFLSFPRCFMQFSLSFLICKRKILGFFFGSLWSLSGLLLTKHLTPCLMPRESSVS